MPTEDVVPIKNYARSKDEDSRFNPLFHNDVAVLAVEHSF